MNCKGLLAPKLRDCGKLLEIKPTWLLIQIKKSKKNKKGALPFEVVPTVERHQPIVVERVPKIVSSSYSAAQIVEEGKINDGNIKVSSRNMGHTGKVEMDGLSKSLKVKKLLKSKVARSNVVE
ncbi:hypothetical protein V6N13_009343 [Hibiscus sabdariffa]